MIQATKQALPPRKKVLFVITKSNWGGAQRYVFDLATSLPSDRYEPVVAFGGTGIVGSASGELAAKLQEAKIRSMHLPALGRNINPLADIRSFFSILRLVRKERPDILHLNSSKAGGLGALAGRLMGVPRIVYTAHGWPFWENRNALVRTGIYFFSWLTAFFSHITICISEFDRKQLAQSAFVRNRFVTVYNGIRESEGLWRTIARETLFDADTNVAHSGDIWLCTTAELHPNKNLERAMDAVKKYNLRHEKKIFYVIIGDGELGKKLVQKADAHIAFTGFLRDASNYLLAFDIFLLPSLKEGVPYSLLEAALAGLPVIASTVGGMPEVIGSATDSYLIDPLDTTSIEGALTRVINNLDAPRSDGNAQSIVRNRFTLKRMVEETLKVYENA